MGSKIMYDLMIALAAASNGEITDSMHEIFKGVTVLVLFRAACKIITESQTLHSS